MKQVTQLTNNAFSVTEEGTFERKLKVLVSHNGSITYKCYHGVIFMGDVQAVKDAIIRSVIEPTN